MRFRHLFIFTFLITLQSCSSSPAKVSSCSPGTTKVDGVCVEQDWANFISCVNSQNVELGTEVISSISGSVGYFGIGAEGKREAVENLNKKYTASDSIKKAIIDKCSEMAGLARKPEKHTQKTKKPLVILKEPIQISYIGDYVVSLYYCLNTKNNVTCKFTIENEKGGEAYFHKKSNKGTSAIYYDQGETKTAYKLTVANSGGSSKWFGIKLPPGTPVKGLIEFRGLNIDAIDQLQISIARTILHNPQNASFKNIPVQKG